MVRAERDRGGLLLPRSAPRQFHLLAKPTGAVCNLDCTYCFFLSKELLYPGSRFRMADDLLAAYLRQLIEAQAGAPEVVVAARGLALRGRGGSEISQRAGARARYQTVGDPTRPR